MKNICFVVPRYNPVVGGTEKLCEEILSSFEDSYKVSVITTPTINRNKNNYNYNIYDCSFEQFYLMKEHFEIFNYDLVIFFTDLHTPYLAQYNVSWGKKNICILNLDERTYQLKENFSKATENLKKFDMVVTFTKDGIANKYLQENNIKNIYIPNFSRDILETKLEEDFISKLGLAKNKKTILYNGAYEDRKNQLKIIEYIKSSKSLQEYNWLFIGSVASEEYLRKCILFSSDIKNIKFIKATANTKIVDQIYQQCDCLLLASIAEGMPLVLLEAMSANKPIISTPVGGVEGVLKNECDIHILSSINFSIDELEKSILKQLKNQFNFREVWSKMFNKKDVCKKYIILIKEILNEN